VSREGDVGIAEGEEEIVAAGFGRLAIEASVGISRRAETNGRRDSLPRAARGLW